MRPAALLRGLLPFALLAMALLLSAVFFAVPVNKYDWMRDLGETQLPADEDGALRLALTFLPALLAWIAAALAFRSLGQAVAMRLTFSLLALFAAAGLARYTGLIG